MLQPGDALGHLMMRKLGPILFLVCLSSVSRAERPREEWARGLPALSSNGKQLALPVRTLFFNWVKNSLSTAVRFVPVGKTQRQAMPVLDLQAPHPCVSIVDGIIGELPDSKAEQLRMHSQDEAELAAFDMPDRPAHCQLNSETDEPIEREKARLEQLENRLAQNDFKPLRFYRPKQCVQAPLTQLRVDELSIDIIVHQSITGNPVRVELMRGDKRLGHASFRRPAPMRTGDRAGSGSRVVLDFVDGLLVVPARKPMFYVRLVWTDELNGRKVSYRFDDWVVISTDGTLGPL